MLKKLPLLAADTENCFYKHKPFKLSIKNNVNDSVNLLITG